MSDVFDRYLKLVEKSVKHDPWSDEKTLHWYALGLRGEVDELIRAIENNDFDNIREELGDILFDWAHACVIAKNEGLITFPEVIQCSEEKIMRRKPYVVTGESVTKEKARDLWVKAKDNEKKKSSPKKK